MTYADSGAGPVAIDLGGGFQAVATFVAPADGTYVLDGTATLRQSAIGLGILVDLQRAWFDGVGGTQLGPLAAPSTVAEVALLTVSTRRSTRSPARPLGTVASVTLRCRFTGVGLGLGDFESDGWAFTATRAT